MVRDPYYFCGGSNVAASRSEGEGEHRSGEGCEAPARPRGTDRLAAGTATLADVQKRVAVIATPYDRKAKTNIK